MKAPLRGVPREEGQSATHQSRERWWAVGGGERRASRLLPAAVSGLSQRFLCSPLGLPRQDYRSTHPARCASERGGALPWAAGLEAGCPRGAARGAARRRPNATACLAADRLDRRPIGAAAVDQPFCTVTIAQPNCTVVRGLVHVPCTVVPYLDLARSRNGVYLHNRYLVHSVSARG
eukprot:COSAG01_NODE_2186_length_8202_cov_5.667407_8_plen_177_part_00